MLDEASRAGVRGSCNDRTDRSRVYVASARYMTEPAGGKGQLTTFIRESELRRCRLLFPWPLLVVLSPGVGVLASSVREGMFGGCVDYGEPARVRRNNGQVVV